MSSTPELAKLSRPRLYRVMPRERLFRLMDERREHPVMWVAGAPGAGKSSLVASYLEARKLGGVWYHIDAGDADPATFFYYLGLAAPSIAGRKLPPLPLFTDEYRRSLEPFARRWFREFFARMPIGAILVFDNLQDAGGTSEARAALAAGLEETPLGLNVVVVSRAEPPPEFARLIVNQTIARIGPNDLRFTRDEAAALLAADGEVDARVAEWAYERSDGWAAGLILMREHARRGDGAPGRDALATPEAVFTYFAGEIFNRIAPAEQRILTLCALPQRIAATVATALTGAADAGRVLEYGYRRHLFIARRDGVVPSYEFHALFREFLLARARTLLSTEELAIHRRRAAELIEASGAGEGVFELYRDAGDWPNALRVTLADAPELLAQGRFRSLLERVDALPPAARAGDAWLAYWEGIARVNVDPLAARACLHRAYDGFLSRGDEQAEILAAEALIISHYLARDDWRPADRWLEVMERLIGRASFATPDAEARALSSLAVGLVYRQPGHSQLGRYLERLDALLDTLGDKNTKVALAARLIDGFNKVGSLARSQHVARRIRAVLDDPEVRPLTSAWCRVWMVSIALHEGRMAETDALLAEALAIAETHGLPFFASVVDVFRTWGCLTRGELDEAQRLIARLAASIDPARKVDLGLLHFFTAWAAALAGDFAAAEREGRVAAHVSLETGSITSTLTSHAVLALALDETGQRAEAAEIFERVNRLVAEVSGGMVRFHALLWDAYLRLRRGDDTYRASLAEGLALGRREGYLTNYLWWPPMMSRLAAVAIDTAIEPDYVRHVVAARGLPPDETLAADSWPWPLKIRALGRFEVQREGAPIAFRGKAQKKPIELLKALVALGGESVDASRLAAALWPDAAGDAAKVSFDSTLYRLRKLLANDAALVLNEGKLSLDRRQCWVDVWAFERIVREAEASATADAAAAIATRLLDSYPGHFLAADEDQPWALGLRDRLRSKLVRTVLALGKTLQAAARWEDAITLYQRALEHDNLAEDLYRGLMVCCRELGRLSEALQAYRRCRDLLSVVLGLQPSAETEAVRQSLTRTGV